MPLTSYIREIGRGKQGARPLSREQAADAFGQLLDGTATDLEVGAFCLAMRIKGETADELMGFVDATEARLQRVPLQSGAGPVVVLPSYNGARRLPVLTPLLGLLLARHGLPVLIHGTATEDARVCVPQVLSHLGIEPCSQLPTLAPGQLAYVPTELLCPGLKRLLDVRRTVGLRNSAHSVVKLINPCAGAAVLVASYTHAEYAASMAEVFERMGRTALLLRGTEGEAVADTRRPPRMQTFVAGQAGNAFFADEVCKPDVSVGERARAQPACKPDTSSTAAYVIEVLAGQLPIQSHIALQCKWVLGLAQTHPIQK